MEPEGGVRGVWTLLRKVCRGSAGVKLKAVLKPMGSAPGGCWRCLCAVAPEAVVENRLAGRRDLNNYAKARCMIDDMVRDKREARGAIKLSGGGNQPPPDVDQLKLREITSEFAEKESEGGSDTSSFQKLAESSSAIVETLNSASKVRAKEKARRVSGPKKLPLEVSGRAHRRDGMWRATASRGRSTTCVEGSGPPRGCAPVKDGLTRTRQKEKPPMKTAAGPKRTTKHSIWVPWQRFLFDELSIRTA